MELDNYTIKEKVNIGRAKGSNSILAYFHSLLQIRDCEQLTLPHNISLERTPCEAQKWDGVVLRGRSARGCYAA